MMVREFAEANDITCFSCIVEALLDMEPKFPDSGFKGQGPPTVNHQLPEELQEEFQALLEEYAKRCPRKGKRSS